MDIRRTLKKALKGKVTVIGVGNAMRGDDGFGIDFVEHLRDNISACVISGGAAPENHAKAVRESAPDTVIVVDAADFGGKEGDVTLLKRDDLPLYGISTHNASLALFFDFLKNEAKAEVYLLAVQPERCDMDTALSDTAAKKRDELQAIFMDLLPI